MVLPNFLGIGAQRCGTTLLNAILETHPEIYVPTRRKEIHFFDRHFDRGLDWYRSFFPDGEAAKAYRAIGEVTPDYIYFAEAAERIIETMPRDCRFIVTLRHPARRVFSGYTHHRRAFNEKRPFERFVDEQEDATARGFYSRQLQRFFDAYPREQFLILIFEEWLKEPAPALDQIRSFLGLTHGWANPETVLAEKTERTTVPYFPTAFYWARSFGQMLTRRDLDWLVNIVKATKVHRLFGVERAPAGMPPAMRERLDALYADEVRSVERLLGREIHAWR
ncbi:MAG: sulfotransferase [Geminicoccaceae bacterium]|nr:sulfotransferase [Geminicoccaceae bacterium]